MINKTITEHENYLFSLSFAPFVEVLIEDYFKLLLLTCSCCNKGEANALKHYKQTMQHVSLVYTH